MAKNAKAPKTDKTAKPARKPATGRKVKSSPAPVETVPEVIDDTTPEVIDLPIKTEEEATTPTVATPATPATNGAAKADGLGKPQVRVLNCLKSAGRGLTRKEIAEKAPADLASLNSVIGCVNPTLLATPHFAPSLLRRGFVKMEMHDEDGKNVLRYSLTAKGAEAIETAAK